MHHPASATRLTRPAAPVEVPAAASAGQAERAGAPATTAASIAVVVVTWNRRAAADAVVGALARQAYPRDRMDVVIVDNASTDGTLGALAERWRPERIVDNPTRAAHEPDFRVPPPAGNGKPIRNRAGFRSLTIVRNHHNHGGCGGFNTGFAYVERVLAGPGGAAAPDYVWLVDDDVDLPPDALERLVEAAQADASIGLVGSRTVDFNDRQTTIETTIYFDAERGWMGPDPPARHRLRADHERWVAEVGGTKGRREFRGLREVDILSACSLLARWSAVQRVGFWDARYFIYCDDADWCLRFPRHGYRVVLNLDAVVYHTNWLQKLTPKRAYYSQRNMVWTIQKALPAGPLRRATLRWFAHILLDARKAAMHCRLAHANLYLRTVRDIIADRGGRLDEPAMAPGPVVEALRRAGALRPGATIAVMCGRAGFARAADELRERVAAALAGDGSRSARAEGEAGWKTGPRKPVPPGSGKSRGRAADAAAGPRWVYFVREGLPDPTAGAPGAPERITYRPNRWSKLAARAWFLLRPPTAVVVFDNFNDFPLLRSRANVHIDRRAADAAFAERDGLLRRAAFLARWAVAAARAGLYALRVGPREPRGRYG